MGNEKLPKQVEEMVQGISDLLEQVDATMVTEVMINNLTKDAPQLHATKDTVAKDALQLHAPGT